MKSTTLLFMLFLGFNLYGQTDSVEREILNKHLQSKEISKYEYGNTLRLWEKAMTGIINYPELPYDKSGDVHYTFIRQFPYFNKEKLFTRVLEYLAINYGLFPSYIYTDPVEGKIILRNSVTLSTGHSCFYTSVVSVKNEKILVEYTDISYQTYYEGYFSGDIWIPEKFVNFGFNKVFPIILKDPSEWNSNINLLKATNQFFSNDIEDITGYIIQFDTAYKF